MTNMSCGPVCRVVADKQGICAAVTDLLIRLVPSLTSVMAHAKVGFLQMSLHTKTDNKLCGEGLRCPDTLNPKLAQLIDLAVDVI